MYDERGTSCRRCFAAGKWFCACQDNPRNKRNNSTPTANPLVDHPAVAHYRAEGVSTDDLVSFIESFASLRAGRVKNIGHDQYAHSKGQHFESFTPQESIKELLEELADASNYIDFLAIKLLNWLYTMEMTQVDCE